MMFARCPACQTVFRVRPEQLRTHRGEVRCGRCQIPFNALEHLLEADPGPTAPAPPATPSPAEANEPAAPGNALRSGPSGDEDGRRDNFFILEERPSDFAGDSRQPDRHVTPSGPPWEPASHARDEATTADETPPPIGGATDGIDDPLDFEIPDKLLVPRRPLRTSDLLRREPVIGEPAIEPPPKEPAPLAKEPPPGAGEPSFPDFIDLSDFGPAEPAMRPAVDVPGEELPDFGRRVPFDEWAQRVRSKGGDRSDADAAVGLAADGGPSVPDTVPQPDLPREPEAAIHGPSGESAAGSAALPEPDTVIPDTDSPPAAWEAGRVPTDDALETDRLDAAYGPRPASPAKRWLLGLGIGLLLGVLAVQATYLFRAEITREWPQLRPAFLTACEALGCTVPLPRIADMVGIATSDLQSEPGGAGRFILNATVRNRAPHPQAYPHLELTLTDAQDRPVIRRVLEPKEWVPPRQLQRAGIEDGFGGGSEIAVKVPFEAGDVAAVGYRLYVFYP